MRASEGEIISVFGDLACLWVGEYMLWSIWLFGCWEYQIWGRNKGENTLESGVKGLIRAYFWIYDSPRSICSILISKSVNFEITSERIDTSLSQIISLRNKLDRLKSKLSRELSTTVLFLKKHFAKKNYFDRYILIPKPQKIYIFDVLWKMLVYLSLKSCILEYVMLSANIYIWKTHVTLFNKII